MSINGLTPRVNRLRLTWGDGSGFLAVLLVRYVWDPLISGQNHTHMRLIGLTSPIHSSQVTVRSTGDLCGWVGISLGFR